jgi:hypothetical protein
MTEPVSARPSIVLRRARTRERQGEVGVQSRVMNERNEDADKRRDDAAKSRQAGEIA